MWKRGCRVILGEETTRAKAVRQAHAWGHQGTLRSQASVARVSAEVRINERRDQKLIVRDPDSIVNGLSLVTFGEMRAFGSGTII